MNDLTPILPVTITAEAMDDVSPPARAALLD